MLPKNEYLMTINERKVFEKLKNTLNQKYEIFPQIPIRALLKRGFEPYRGTKLRKNQHKIIDYLVCEKPYYKPVLAIELNDKTHERLERKIRDSNVTVILREMGIPIWFLLPEQDYKRPDEMNLDKHIDIMIKTWLK